MNRILFRINFYLFICSFILIGLIVISYTHKGLIDKPINVLIKPLDYGYMSRKLNNISSVIDDNNYQTIFDLYYSYKDAPFDNKSHEYAKILFFALSDYWLRTKNLDLIIQESTNLLKINPNENRIRYEYINAKIAQNKIDDIALIELKEILDRHPYDLGFIELYFTNVKFNNYDECVSKLENYLSHVTMVSGWTYEIINKDRTGRIRSHLHTDEFREGVIVIKEIDLADSFIKVNVPSNLFIKINKPIIDNQNDLNNFLSTAVDEKSNSTKINDIIISHGKNDQYFYIIFEDTDTLHNNISLRFKFDFSLQSKAFKNNLCRIN